MRFGTHLTPIIDPPRVRPGVAAISPVLVSGQADYAVLVRSLGRIVLFLRAIRGRLHPGSAGPGHGAAEVARGRCFHVPAGVLLRER